MKALFVMGCALIIIGLVVMLATVLSQTLTMMSLKELLAGSWPLIILIVGVIIMLIAYREIT
jgi:hypothetical protein